MTDQHVLVLGVGNLLLSDDGVGIHVVRELEKRGLPECVEVIDGGTGGAELIRFFEDKIKAIIVDAMRAEGQPGALYRLPLEELSDEIVPSLSVHGTGLGELIHCCKRLDHRPPTVVYGIVPQETATLSVELSEAVQKQVTVVATLIQNEVNETIGNGTSRN